MKNNYKYLLSCATGLALLLSQAGSVFADDAIVLNGDGAGAANNSDSLAVNVQATPLTVCNARIHKSMGFSDESKRLVDFGELSNLGVAHAYIDKQSELKLFVNCASPKIFKYSHNGGENYGAGYQNGTVVPQQNKLKADNFDSYILYSLTFSYYNGAWVSNYNVDKNVQISTNETPSSPKTEDYMNINILLVNDFTQYVNDEASGSPHKDSIELMVEWSEAS